MSSKAKLRTNALALVVIGVLLVIVTSALFRMQRQIEAAQAEQASLETQLAAQKQENAALEAALDKADDVEYLQELARDELGYVTPGEKDFYDISSK